VFFGFMLVCSFRTVAHLLRGVENVTARDRTGWPIRTGNVRPEYRRPPRRSAHR